MATKEQPICILPHVKSTGDMHSLGLLIAHNKTRHSEQNPVTTPRKGTDSSKDRATTAA